MNRRNVLLGSAVVLLAAGCSSGSSSGGSSNVGLLHTHHPHSRTPSPTPTPTTTTVTAAPPPTATVTASTAVPACLSSQLSLSLGQAGGAAGTTYTPIVFTNTGASRCELRAYPGVSFVDTSGAQLGKAASRDPGKIRTITLASGGSANAMLRQPEAGNFSPADCHAATADRLRVYPPGERTPLFVKDHSDVCTTKTGRTGIGPVTSGSGG